MKTSDFSFELPEGLIAQFPPERRGESRLMALDRASRTASHHLAAELPRLLEKGTLLVFNNSKVRRARLLGVSERTGARAEFLLLRELPSAPPGFSGESRGRFWEALVQRSKRRRAGSRYIFGGGMGAVLAGGGEERRALVFDGPVDDAWLDIHGRVPLPPYIRRGDTPDDGDRYQTVYAAVTGSAAAPTAGLHFTREILAGLERHGMECAFVTLHVGLGTFLPVRSEHIEGHSMHEEFYTIDDETAARIEKARGEGRKILAVGTTSVRTLESAWDEKTGTLRRGGGATSIFIYPGYTFRAVDMLFTNFHTPRSTLLMLACAFAGRDFILESYAEAVRRGYRFFSYGDAMLIR
ncbi:MAG: tRNA preQ1(34) S-adenosylmethionine ribosyltransferase-isomerase QueA [Spirochaetaceae bacterium]|jgi:S-adenosylmethionine:tRNA ribosyltransferase-isomerase|nr:tRNA preQ1(34) S-adenosylmethionine ribosyltransferase-isomerase QueA [Spirochaetaceae bacterium]